MNPQEVTFEEIPEHATLPSFEGRMVVLRQNRLQDRVMTPIQEQCIPINEVQSEVIPYLQSEQIESSPNDEVMALRRSSRIRKSPILDDYIVYLIESNFDVGLPKNPITFSQAMSGDKSTFWLDALNNELESIYKNQVWDLVELPEGATTVGYKCVFKTKRDSSGNVK